MIKPGILGFVFVFKYVTTGERKDPVKTEQKCRAMKLGGLQVVKAHIHLFYVFLIE